MTTWSRPDGNLKDMNTNTIPLQQIPGLDVADSNELRFKEPWEAKAFAMVVYLNQQGHFEWSEWAEELGRQITAAGADDDGSQYYQLWLNAAENLLHSKSLCPNKEISARRAALTAAQHKAQQS